jgi:uncharacterized protein YjdB
MSSVFEKGKMGIRSFLSVTILSFVMVTGVVSLNVFGLPANAEESGGSDKTYYELVYDPGEGSGTMASEEVYDGQIYSFPECSFEPPKGMTFLRWEMTGVDIWGGIHPEDTVEIVSNCLFNGVIKVTAIWENAPEASVVTDPEPVEKTLTYDGSPHQLVTAGEAEDGVMKYAVTKSDTAPDYSLFSAALPSITDAGSYYIWYRAVGDENHSNTDPKYVTKEIGPKSITGATVSFSAVVYDGAEHNAIIDQVRLGDIILTAVDYELSGETSAKEVGTYNVTITGKGNYKDSITAQWTIDKKDAPFISSINVKQKKGKLTISWDKTSAKTVKVYVAYNGKKFAAKNTKSTDKTSVTLKKLDGKAIKFNKTFKLYLEGFDSNGKSMGKTPTAYVAGKDNSKLTNAKSIKLTKKSLSVDTGKTVNIKASVKLADKKKKLPKNAAKLRYVSSDETIATVDKKGAVKGVNSGTCFVYVFAVNGLAKKVEITVK